MTSVVKSKQQVTTMRFIEIARQLDAFTLRMAQRLPKRTAFYLNVHLTDLSNNIARCVQIANSIYVVNEQDYAMRRSLLLEAKGYCQALSSKIDLVAECSFKKQNDNNKACIAAGSLQLWVHLLSEEIALITGVIKTDASRWRTQGGTTTNSSMRRPGTSAAAASLARKSVRARCRAKQGVSRRSDNLR
ncbi:MAG: hypothetical protein RR204_06665 [Raoultibacter sp.]